MRAHIDEPTGSVPVDPLGFRIAGWVWLGVAQPEVVGVEAWCGDNLVGETSAIFARPDVTASLTLPGDARTGFELFAHHPSAVPGREFDLHVRVRRRDGTHSAPLTNRRVMTIPRDYRQHHFGILLDQRTTAIQREGNIWAEGPSQREGSPEVEALLHRYLEPGPLRVLDVGCGLGAYARGLLAAGYDWVGAEVDAADCAELARLGLPHRRVDGRTLPFPEATFHSALLLEVLEHIADPRPFLAEVHRVAPRQLIVSVPNCELLGYLSEYNATPWHMLEADHKNFFTRWSLGALLREFYPRVELGFHSRYTLPTREGTPLYYHIFAVASDH
jgi:SAM-dependent methyltransferase